MRVIGDVFDIISCLSAVLSAVLQCPSSFLGEWHFLLMISLESNNVTHP